MTQLIQKLARKAGDLATEVLFSEEIGAQYQLAAIGLQNSDIQCELGTEDDPSGLTAIYAEALAKPLYAGLLPTTTLSAEQLRDEYLGQIQAEADALSRKDAASSRPGNETLLNQLDTLKSTVAANLYQQKNAAKRHEGGAEAWKDIFYTGVGGFVEALSSVEGRAKITEKYAGQADALAIERLPLLDAGYAGLLPAIHAAARLALAHEVVRLHQQHADPREIADARAAWEEACLAEPTSQKIQGDVQQLPKFLNTRQLDFSRKNLQESTSEELRLSSEFLLAGHMGHVLASMVDADPLLLGQPQVREAADAMGQLAHEQFKAVQQAVQRLNASPKRAAPEGVLRPNLETVLAQAVEQTQTTAKTAPAAGENPLPSLLRQLRDGLLYVFRQVRGWISREDAPKAEDAKPVDMRDRLLTGIVAASEQLAQAYPQNAPRIDEAAKEALDGYVVRQTKDLKLTSLSPLVQSVLDASVAEPSKALGQ